MEIIENMSDNIAMILHRILSSNKDNYWVVAHIVMGDLEAITDIQKLHENAVISPKECLQLLVYISSRINNSDTNIKILSDDNNTKSLVSTNPWVNTRMQAMIF